MSAGRFILHISQLRNAFRAIAPLQTLTLLRDDMIILNTQRKQLLH